MILLLDSASLWYRAFYGMPDSLRSPSGQPVNAIRGFLDSVARLTAVYQPKQTVAESETTAISCGKWIRISSHTAPRNLSPR